MQREEEVILEAAQEIHRKRFHGLSDKQLEERWRIIQGNEEGRVYREMAAAVLQKSRRGQC
ncbi:MAG: hypothetical protein GWN86_25030 [Desulfobacterales bacterium]|nr:hypothetical protein [Desulfobacterales bacterium]